MAIELLYGRNAVREALRAGRRRIYAIYLVEGVKVRDALADIVALAERAGVPVRTASREQMDKRLAGTKHHGILAEASPYPYVPLRELQELCTRRDPPPLVLMLDHLQDPQNMATLLRTAEALGVDGVVMPMHRAAGITPAVVNASAGAVEHLRIAQETNLVRAMQALQEAGLWLVGLEQAPGARLYTEADLAGPLGLVVGSEGEGMHRLVRETCDFLVYLPMTGQVNSLNAAVAGSVALYEVWRQRAGLPRSEAGEKGGA
ncbi:MAG: 23S rRNA (guanosine(2251)-2'-O)-methyltransferase RlmB [Anaerolineae bacterium]